MVIKKIVNSKVYGAFAFCGLVVAVLCSFMMIFMMVTGWGGVDKGCVEIGFQNKASATVYDLDYEFDGGGDDVEFQRALNALHSDGGAIYCYADIDEGRSVSFNGNVTRAIDNVCIVGDGLGLEWVKVGGGALFVVGGDGWQFRKLNLPSGAIDYNGHEANTTILDCWVGGVWTNDSQVSGGSHITVTNSVASVDDDFLLNTGDVGSGVYDFGGASSFEIPNGNDTDVDAIGEVSFDANNFMLRGYDGSAQFVFGMKAFSISFTVLNPADLSSDTARGDASCVVWHNFTGCNFVIESIKAWSDDDNLDFQLFESNSGTDIDTGTDSLIDTLECEDDGTDVYTDSETSFNDGIVASDKCIVFLYSDGSGEWVHVEILGYLNGDVA